MRSIDDVPTIPGFSQFNLFESVYNIPFEEICRLAVS